MESLFKSLSYHKQAFVVAISEGRLADAATSKQIIEEYLSHILTLAQEKQDSDNRKGYRLERWSIG